MLTMPKPMSKTEYADALERVGFSNRSFCLEVLDVDDRSGRYWIDGTHAVPGSVAALLRLAIRLKLTPEKLRELVR